MNLLTLLTRVLDEVPSAETRGFRQVCNRAVNDLWGMKEWEHYYSETSMTTTHTFTNLTVANGATTATVTDADAGGLFDASHVGKVFTIEDETYTVQSVTSANVLVLSTTSTDTGTGLGGSLPRVVLTLPSAFRRMVKVYLEGDEENYLVDPDDYTLRIPSGGTHTLQLEKVLVGSTDYVVRYFRQPTAVTELNSTVDVSAGMEDALFYALAKKYYQQRPPQTELEMLPWQRRVSEYEASYEQALQRALKEDRLRRRMQRRNAPVMFRNF